MIERNDIGGVGEILEQIDSHMTKWKISMRSDPFGMERVVRLAVPMLGGPSIDVRINIPRMRKFPGEGIMLFVHKMLTD
jgi:hypothetical protein